MSYVAVENFKSGFDRRRAIRAAGEPGSLWLIKNAHITRGADIESMKKFVSTYDLPSGTFGLHSVRGRLFVFGSGSTPAGMPGGVQYQQLAHQDGVTDMVKLVDSENFDGKIYAIAEFDDGAVYHYYDGSRVTDWDTIAAAVGNNETIALYLADKIDGVAEYSASAVGDTITIIGHPGVSYTTAKSTVDNGVTNDQDITLTNVQAAVAAVEEVQATGSFTIVAGSEGSSNKISSITVNGIEVLGADVMWSDSNEFTAELISQQINVYESTPEYTASFSGSVVTVSAAVGTGSGPNGFAVVVTAEGLVSVGSVVNMSGGVDEVDAAPQIDTAQIVGTFEGADEFVITLDGVDFKCTGAASGTGRSLLTYKGKLYSTVLSLAYFCAIEGPTQWTSGTGYGNINFANQDEGSESLLALEVYQGNIGVFSRNNVQVEYVAADPSANALLHSIRKTGTRAGRSVLAYGNNDVFYLANTGIRSIRARDSSNAPYVNDVGTFIDPYVLEVIDAQGGSVVADSHAIIEPREGRYWLAIGDKIFVFSYFPGSKISAWSIYEPGITFSAFATVGERVFGRSGDTIYQYGGANGNTYPVAGEVSVEIQLPFLTAGKPGTFKTLRGVDIVADKVWSVNFCFDPNDESKVSETVTLRGVTPPYGRPMVDGKSTHIAPNLSCSSGGRAVLSSVVIHFSAAGEI